MVLNVVSGVFDGVPMVYEVVVLVEEVVPVVFKVLLVVLDVLSIVFEVVPEVIEVVPVVFEVVPEVIEVVSVVFKVVSVVFQVVLEVVSVLFEVVSMVFEAHKGVPEEAGVIRKHFLYSKYVAATLPYSNSQLWFQTILNLINVFFYYWIHRQVSVPLVLYSTIIKPARHRTALLVFWSLKPAVSSDRSIPVWQSHKIGNT